MAMEIIDRDEREPGGDAAKGRGPKRVAESAACCMASLEREGQERLWGVIHKYCRDNEY